MTPPRSAHLPPVASTITCAPNGERGAVLDVLVQAFRMDPLTRWAFPDPATYRDAFGAFAVAFAGSAFELGSAWCVRGFFGAALWLPPGAGPDEGAVAAVFERYVPPERLGVMFTIMQQMGGHHPGGPHWHLPLIGVDPARQGRGHGSALLHHAAEWLDRERQVAYLESTNPLNVPLYERHGFDVVGTIQSGNAPPVFPMVRRPR